MKKSAGLILFTEIPAMGGLVAILQVRGTYNHEKMAPESYPGGCQVTAHGKSNDEEETHYDILCRELREEFGDAAASMITAQWNGAVELNHVEEKEDVMTWGLKVTPDFLTHVKLSASTGGLRMLSQNDTAFMTDLRSFEKSKGVEDRTLVAMFMDEAQAVGLGFEKFGTPVVV